MISKRSGKEMAFVTVEDLYGTIEVVFWQNMFQKFKDLLVVDNIVKVAGKLSVREGVKPSVMVDNIEKMTSGAEPKQVAPSEKPKTLYLKFNTKDDSLKTDILDILKSYPGTSDVVIKCSVTNQIYKLNIRVNLNSFVNQELLAIVGESNIVVR